MSSSKSSKPDLDLTIAALLEQALAQSAQTCRWPGWSVFPFWAGKGCQGSCEIFVCKFPVQVEPLELEREMAGSVAHPVPSKDHRHISVLCFICMC